jgi:hypothetical protein
LINICLEEYQTVIWEEKLKSYKVKWEEQVEVNRKLHTTLVKIRNTTDDELMKAIA